MRHLVEKSSATIEETKGVDMKGIIEWTYRSMSKINTQLCRILTYTIGSVLAAMAIILFASVILRYVFNSPLPWTQDVLNILMVWMVLLGAPVGLRAGSHVAIESVVEKLPALMQKVLKIIVILIIAFVSWQILRYGWAFAMKGMRRIVPSLDWLRFGYVYMALPVGYGLLLMITLEQLLSTIHQMINGRKN